jgi:hypothetical protein
MKLHDIIRTKTDLPNIPKWSEGTIIFVYRDGVYEVEFIINGETITETIIL